MKKPSEVRAVSVPMIDERTLTKVGAAAYLLSIHPSWLSQYALTSGDVVLILLDLKEKRLLVIPRSDKRKAKLEAAFGKKNVKEKPLQEFGGSIGVFIPSKWVDKLRLAGGDKLLALSNFGMSFEKYTPEKKKILHEKFRVLGDDFIE